jgi:hypothetical protein
VARRSALFRRVRIHGAQLQVRGVERRELLHAVHALVGEMEDKQDVLAPVVLKSDWLAV